MAAKCASPAPPLGEKHIFENQTVKLGVYHNLPAGKALGYLDFEKVASMTSLRPETMSAATVDAKIEDRAS